MQHIDKIFRKQSRYFLIYSQKQTVQPIIITKQIDFLPPIVPICSVLLLYIFQNNILVACTFLIFFTIFAP